jgi:hypothetical protein
MAYGMGEATMGGGGEKSTDDEFICVDEAAAGVRRAGPAMAYPGGVDRKSGGRSGRWLREESPKGINLDRLHPILR